jgi:hypothetical protein
MIETNVPYVVEGEILPRHVAELRDEFGSVIQSCFVGYADLNVESKFEQVRANTGFDNDWTSELSDSALMTLLTEGIELFWSTHTGHFS